MYKNSLKPSTLFIAVNAILFTTSVYAEDIPSAELPTIEIIATTEEARGAVDGLAANRVSSTTGTDESILKSTQSVSVIGQQEINTVGAQSMKQVLDYTAGVTGIFGADTGSNTGTGFNIRGFGNYTSYRDGQKFQANAFESSQELFGLERIEVVKGPDSLLNGAIPPGGMVNTITKRPKFDDSGEMNVEVGSFNRKVFSTDINMTLSDTVAARFVGLSKDSDTFIDITKDNKKYFAPSITWQPTDDTRVDVIASYENGLNQNSQFYPVEGILLPSEHGKIKIDTFLGVEGFDKKDSERTTIGYDVTHNFTPDLKLKHNFSKMKYDHTLNRHDFMDQVDKSPMYTRELNNRYETGKTMSTGISLQYDWSAGDNIENTTLMGVDYSKESFDSTRSDIVVNNINIFNPDHSKDTIDQDTKNTYAVFMDTGKQQGVYLQNQLTYNDQLVALVGLRHTKYEAGTVDYLDPEYSGTQDTSATTGRAGLAYVMDNGLAPYTSINQSFEMEAGTDRQGNRFDPTEGIQYETGVRYQPEGSDMLLTASVYRIDQSNVLTDDPIDDDYEVQLGKVRSQGFELEAKTQIGDNANLIAAYNYTDARVIESSPTTPEYVGERMEYTPYNNFSIFGDYRFTNYNIPQLKAGLGIRYVGDTIMANNEGLDSPAYTLADLMASYDFSDNINLSLNVRNLLDNDSPVCDWTCSYIQPRNIKAKLSYKW